MKKFLTADRRPRYGFVYHLRVVNVKVKLQYESFIASKRCIDMIQFIFRQLIYIMYTEGDVLF